LKRHPAWAVAAAILAEGEYRLNYKYLAEEVISTNLSGLKEEEGKTPWQTLGKVMRDYPDIFGWFDGDYWVKDAELALENKKVRAAFDALKDKQSK